MTNSRERIERETFRVRWWWCCSGWFIQSITDWEMIISNWGWMEWMDWEYVGGQMMHPQGLWLMESSVDYQSGLIIYYSWAISTYTTCYKERDGERHVWCEKKNAWGYDAGHILPSTCIHDELWNLLPVPEAVTQHTVKYILITLRGWTTLNSLWMNHAGVYLHMTSVLLEAD